jgi:predicted dinucleotide-utilizing enzyme
VSQSSWLLLGAARRPGRRRGRHRRLGPSSSATTSTTERALPSSAVQLRCWSRPTTTTRLPFESDCGACLVWSRHTITVKNDASCSRRPETATRNKDRGVVWTRLCETRAWIGPVQVRRGPDHLRQDSTRSLETGQIRENIVLSELARQVPVINVAESRPKKQLEAPCIGRATWEALRRHLKHEPWLRRNLRVLILGFGALGHAVTLSLRNLGRVSADRIYVYDPDSRASRRVRALGFRTWNREEATDSTIRFNLVIGCSGHQSFTVDDVSYLDDRAALVSASSGAGELSREAFLGAADASAPPDGILGRDQLCELSPHHDLEIQLQGRRIHFLNGGFPVIFDGRINNVPPRYIQVTLALMVAGAVQAVQAEAGGLLDFDKTIVEWIESRFPSTEHLLNPRLPLAWTP